MFYSIEILNQVVEYKNKNKKNESAKYETYAYNCICEARTVVWLISKISYNWRGQSYNKARKVHSCSGGVKPSDIVNRGKESLRRYGKESERMSSSCRQASLCFVRI